MKERINPNKSKRITLTANKLSNLNLYLDNYEDIQILIQQNGLMDWFSI